MPPVGASPVAVAAFAITVVPPAFATDAQPCCMRKGWCQVQWFCLGQVHCLPRAEQDKWMQQHALESSLHLHLFNISSADETLREFGNVASNAAPPNVLRINQNLIFVRPEAGCRYRYAWCCCGLSKSSLSHFNTLHWSDPLALQPAASQVSECAHYMLCLLHDSNQLSLPVTCNRIMLG